MPARPAASTPRRGGRRGPVGGGNVGPAAPIILRPLPFVLRCLGDLFPSVFLRARHVAPSTCRGRCRTSGGSGQGAYSGLPDFACLLSPAPPAPALSPLDLFLHRRICTLLWTAGMGIASHRLPTCAWWTLDLIVSDLLLRKSRGVATPFALL